MSQVRGTAIGPKSRSTGGTEDSTKQYKMAQKFDLMRHSMPKHDHDVLKNQKRVDNCKWLWDRATAKTVPGIWQNMQKMQKAQSLQGSVQIDTEAVDRL